MNKPRKDELSSAAKLLKSKASQLRNCAKGNRDLAAIREQETRQGDAAWLLKNAEQKEKKADVWERVAEWITKP